MLSEIWNEERTTSAEEGYKRGSMTIWRRRFGAAVLAPQFWRRSFGARTFWRRDVLALRRFGAETFWRRRFGADVLAPERFGAETFWRHCFFSLIHC